MTKYLLCKECEGFFDEQNNVTIDTYIPVKMYDSLDDALFFIDRNLEVIYLNAYGPKSSGKGKKVRKNQTKEHTEFYKTESDVLVAEFYPNHVIFPMDDSGEFDLDEIIRWNNDLHETFYIDDFTYTYNREEGVFSFNPSVYPTTNEEDEEEPVVTNNTTISFTAGTTSTLLWTINETPQPTTNPPNDAWIAEILDEIVDDQQ